MHRNTTIMLLHEHPGLTIRQIATAEECTVASARVKVWRLSRRAMAVQDTVRGWHLTNDGQDAATSLLRPPEQKPRAGRTPRRVRRPKAQRWDQKTPAERAAWAQRSREAWAVRYPDRRALVDETRRAIDDGLIVPGPCDTCGVPGEPLFDWDTLTIRGWRCMPCKRAIGRRSRPPA